MAATPLVVHVFTPGRREDEEPPDRGGGAGGGGAGRPEAIPLSDDQLAQRFSDSVLRDNFVHVASDRKWRRWDDRCWAREETLEVDDLARELCRRESQGLEDARLARGISGEPTIRRVEKLARAMRRHARRADDFDTDLERLNTQYGIVDLGSGQLFPHDRAALMTKITAVGAEATTGCPTWLRVLGEATGGDQALIDYLQRVFGYALFGVVTEHVVVIFHGRVGGEGKTLILGTVAGVMGDYAETAPMDMFTVTQGERHPTELAGLAGARLVIASEIEEGRRWDEVKLKSLTGGDPIRARFMRGDHFTFRPQLTLVVATNHLPEMRSAAGMRRRLQVVPFRHRPAVPDPELPEKLKAEWPGILAWMIEGAARWRQIGLAPPPVVVDATAEYFEQESAVGLWMKERCVDDPLAEATTKELHRDFQSWAGRAGERGLSERKFVQKLTEVSGLSNGKVHKGAARGFFGIALRHGTRDLYDATGERRSSAGWVVEANTVPGDPVPDDAEDFDR